METYQGIKFHYRSVRDSFTCADSQLTTLNWWANLFSQLGLTPIHADGAYGNQSCRTGESSFFITRSGMTPSSEFNRNNFSHVIDFDETSNSFLTEGQAIPSSESLLHCLLYRAQPDINAIFHGHSRLFLEYATTLKIPSTHTFCQYGTQELAESALELIDGNIRFFLLKDHGFVAMGEDLASAGKLTLRYLSELIETLHQSAANDHF